MGTEENSKGYLSRESYWAQYISSKVKSKLGEAVELADFGGRPDAQKVKDELTKATDAAEAWRLLQNYRDFLRPKKGLRVTSHNESDLPEFDVKLLKLWQQVSSSRQLTGEKKQQFINCLIDFWFGKDNWSQLQEKLQGLELNLDGLKTSISDECRFHQSVLYDLCAQEFPNKLQDQINCKPKTRAQEKFKSIAKQFTAINPHAIKELQTDFFGLDSFDDLVTGLHKKFAETADEVYFQLTDDTYSYIDQLAADYLGNHYFPGLSRKERERKYWDRQRGNLTEAEQKLENAFNAYASAIITKKKINEEELKRLREPLFSELGKSAGSFKIEKLTHDLKFIAERTQNQKKFYDKKLNQLRKDINSLSELYHVKSAIQDKPKEDFFKPPFATHQEATGLTSLEEQNYRCLHKRFNRLSILISFMVAIGEGVVAAVGMLALGLAAPIAWPLALLTFIAGAFTNYLLIRDDSLSMLLEFFHKKRVKDQNGEYLKKEDGSYVYENAIFLDENDCLISNEKKAAMVGTVIFAIAVGAVYGALSAHSLLFGVFVKIGLMHALIGLGISLAAGPIFFTAIGMAAITYVVIADIIKNDRLSGAWSYIKDTFFPSYFKELTTKEKILFGFSFVFNALKIIIGLGLVIAITVASFGVFHAKGIKLLQLIANYSASNIADDIACGFSAVVGLIFGVRKQFRLTNPISGRDVVNAFFKLINPFYMIPALIEVGLKLVSSLCRAAILKPACVALRAVGVKDAKVNWYQSNIYALTSFRRFIGDSTEKLVKRMVPGKTFCELKPPEEFHHDLIDLNAKAKTPSVVKVVETQHSVTEPLLAAEIKPIEEAKPKQTVLTDRQFRLLTVEQRQPYNKLIQALKKDIEDKLGFTRLILVGSIILNGFGQGFLFRGDGGNFIEAVFKIPLVGSQSLALVSEVSYSCSMNTVAGFDALNNESCVEVKDLRPRPETLRGRLFNCFDHQSASQANSVPYTYQSAVPI